MRVLLVSQEMPPETAWGGIGTYVDVLSEALAADGIEVHVVSVVEDQPASTRVLGEVTVHREPLPRLRGARRLPPETFKRVWLPAAVRRVIERLDMHPTVIECPEWGAEGLGLGLQGRYPLVVRLHSSARQLFPHTRQGREWRGLDGWLAARLEELSARRANVVVSTQSNLDEIAATMRLDPGALHPIPYPVRLPERAPMPSPDASRITFVGRLEPRKAPDVLLGAAPLVLAEVPEARFVFVGRDGIAPGLRPSTDWLRAEADRLGISERIELTGHLDRDRVMAEIGRAAVCAFPSRWESFGNVVAEASALGRPVLVAAIPPFRELVEDGVTGRIIEGESPQAWASALVEMVRSPERAAAWGAAGAERIASISAPAHVARLAVHAYEHAIDRWKRGLRAAAPSPRGRPVLAAPHGR